MFRSYSTNKTPIKDYNKFFREIKNELSMWIGTFGNSITHKMGIQNLNLTPEEFKRHLIQYRMNNGKIICIVYISFYWFVA